MGNIWSFIQGKKTSIATIAGAVLIFCLNRGVVDADTAQLISVILAGLGISANVGNAIVKKANGL